MVPQIPTFFCGMSLVLMVLTIEARVSPRKASDHLVRPFKEWFIFYPFENSMHRFSKYSINHVGIGRSCRSDIIFPRSNGIESVRPKIPPLLRDNFRFTFSLLLIFLNLFIFINPVHNLAHTGNKFASKDFFSPCSLGRPTWKCWWLRLQNHHLFRCTSPNTYSSMPSKFHPLTWIGIVANPRV